MPGPFSPSDTLVGAIAHQIALLVAAQIPSIGTVYEELPDRTPADNSVTIQMIKGKVVAETSGKMRVALTYAMRHLFRRESMAASTQRAYSYVIPWMQFLAAWPNQSLGGLAMEVNATDVGITQTSQSGQPMVALVVLFTVETEFNISLT